MLIFVIRKPMIFAKCMLRNVVCCRPETIPIKTSVTGSELISCHVYNTNNINNTSELCFEMQAWNIFLWLYARLFAIIIMRRESDAGRRFGTGKRAVGCGKRMDGNGLTLIRRRRKESGATWQLRLATWTECTTCSKLTNSCSISAYSNLQFFWLNVVWWCSTQSSWATSCTAPNNSVGALVICSSCWCLLYDGAFCFVRSPFLCHDHPSCKWCPALQCAALVLNTSNCFAQNDCAARD